MQSLTHAPSESGSARLSPPDASVIESILRSCPEKNSFETLSLPPIDQTPSVVRRAFLKLSLKVHPDKCSHHRSKEAFQVLSSAFEILYDAENQKQHLRDVLLQQEQRQRTTTTSSACTTAATKKNESRFEKKGQRNRGCNNDETTTTEDDDPRGENYSSGKKRNHRNSGRDRKEKKKRRKANDETTFWSQRRSWEDVAKELRRLEELERGFVRRNRDERHERKTRGMIWKAMKICRALDERAGCPPTFVNGLWAPLYEQEVHATHHPPKNWETRWIVDDDDPSSFSTTKKPATAEAKKRVYRYTPTGEESEAHPVPGVEALLEKARRALETNKSSFRHEPRLFLDEIVEYLREDHDYRDMDDDMTELEEEEKAAASENRTSDSSSTSRNREYDY